MIGFVFIASLAIIWLAYAAWKIESRRLIEKRQRFSARDELSPQMIFSKYYGSSNLDSVEFCCLWREIGEILKVDCKKLRPDDRFDLELAPVKWSFNEDEIADLTDWFERQALQRGIGCKEFPKTIGEMICRLLGPS